MKNADRRPRLVVAGSRPWVRNAFERWPERSRCDVLFVGAREELSADALDNWAPDYVFFVHWSWRIPAAIYERHRCIGFHMTDLPFGRGGSPLQNLLVRGIPETQLSAFQIGAELDAGPIFLKRRLVLDGSAQEIYERASALAFSMIDEIVSTDPAPMAQTGEVVIFARRSPADSRIPDGLDGRALYDFIRMLDAEGYPRAFIEWGAYTIEFSDAQLLGETVRATVGVVRSGAGRS